MTQMTNTQRAAIVEAHNYRVDYPNGLRDAHVSGNGARRMMTLRLIAGGALDKRGRVVRAGMVAAGLLDAIHGEALRENAVREMREAEQHQATPAYRHFAAAVRVGKSYRAALDILHAEALVEHRARVECSHGGDCRLHPDAQGLHDLPAEDGDPDPAGTFAWDLSVVLAAVIAWAPPTDTVRLDVERRLQRVEQRLQRARQAGSDDDRKRFDDLAERLCAGIPESWDDDASIDSILVDYVRMIESRLLAAGGTLEKWEGDPDA